LKSGSLSPKEANDSPINNVNVKSIRRPDKLAMPLDANIVRLFVIEQVVLRDGGGMLTGR